ncbi:MAG TPA: ornithine cyclodeaminase family protein [Ktedonobacterales bacterium]|nr:ornithine cyclodeaminase family protein [Ktedonobacterales bacterium]
MTLILREDDVRSVLTVFDTMRVVGGMFRRQGASEVINQPRVRVVLPEGRGVTHTLPAWVPGQPGDPEAAGQGFVGLKTYTAVGGVVRFVVLLSSAEDGRLLAIIEADLLGQMRTGAASGVATQYMAREDARVVAMLGAGGQARTQALAMAAARPISRFQVYSRDAARREAFCAEIASPTGAEAVPVASAEEAVRSADIVVTATTAKDPIMRGEWLRPGTHVNAMGSNWGHRREVDTATITRSALIAVDDLAQARIEAGDLLIPEREGQFNLDEARASGRLVELGAIVAGKTPGRPSADAITLFKSLGIGAEDIATAAYVYKLAMEQGLGQEITLAP